MMFHAFTTDQRLFNKLIERYGVNFSSTSRSFIQESNRFCPVFFLKIRFNVPSWLPAQLQEKIQVRVCVFLKHWVENDILGEAVKNSIREFLKGVSANKKFEMISKSIEARLDQPKVN